MSHHRHDQLWPWVVGVLVVVVIGLCWLGWYILLAPVTPPMR